MEMDELMQADNRFEDDEYQYNEYIVSLQKKEYEFDSRRKNQNNKENENNKNIKYWAWID